MSTAASTTASMQFTPEWLKPGRKQTLTKQPSFSSLDEDPARKGGAAGENIHSTNSQLNTQPSYSSLVSGTTATSGFSLASMDSSGSLNGHANGFHSQDAAHPFRYSKEQMLSVWKDGTGQSNGGLGAEVARWPNIVRDYPTEPAGARELSGDEKKLFSQSLNSNVGGGGGGASHARRHGQGSTSNAPTGLSIGGASGLKSAFGSGGALASPRAERFSPVAGSPTNSLLTRRRKDDSGDTPAAVGVYRPRQLSLSASVGPNSPGGALPSPRRASGVDGVMGDSWMRRRPSERSSALMNAQDSSLATPSTVDPPLETHFETDVQRPIPDGDLAPRSSDPPQSSGLAESPPSFRPDELASAAPGDRGPASIGQSNPGYGIEANSGDLRRGSTDRWGGAVDTNTFTNSRAHTTPSPTQHIANEAVLWRYKDHEGTTQGPFPASMMHSWHGQQYFTENLLIQRHVPPYDRLDPEAYEPLTSYKRKLPPHLANELFLHGMDLAPPRPPNLPMPIASLAQSTSFADELYHRDHSLLPPSRTGSGMSSGPARSVNDYFAQPSQLGGGSAYSSPHVSHTAPNPSGIARSMAVGRQGSIDPFLSGPNPIYPQTAPSPLNSSPALSHGLAQSFGAGNSNNAFPNASSGLLAAERERLEREEYFKSLRERELMGNMNMAPGPSRSNSIGAGVGFGASVGYGSGVVGGNQPISRSPMFANANANVASASPIGSYQQGASPSQSQGMNAAYNNAFPRPGVSAFQQPQQPQSFGGGNAWSSNNGPSGYLARALAGAPTSSGPSPIGPHHQQHGFGSQSGSTWDDSRDAYSRNQDDGWHVHRQNLQNLQQPEPIQQTFFPEREAIVPPSSYMHLNGRYSTVAAVETVQTQSAGNFGLSKGFVEPPETGTVLTAIPMQPQPQPSPKAAETATLDLEKEVDELTKHLDEVEVQTEEPVISKPAVVEPEAPTVVPASEPDVVKSAKRPSKPAFQPPPAPSKPEASAVSPIAPETPAATKSSRKSSAAVPAAAPQESSPTSASPSTPPSAVLLPTKPAWKTTPSSTVVVASSSGPTTPSVQSLRDIQEAEAKAAGARKEKEKALRAAQAAAATSSPSSESAEPLPRTTTWGLGARGTASAAAVATAGSASTTPVSTPGGGSAAASAWAKPTASKGGAAKKTMKEILEEEEKRKKAVAAATAAALANGSGSESVGKKAYVDSAKAGEAKAPTPSSGAGWVTVGSKAATPAPVSSAATISRSPAVATPSKLAAATPPKTAAAIVGSGSKKSSLSDDKKPPAPSPDFLVWMKESLRGLNGVNVDEFIGMLLDFPIEPDTSTMEIISDSVYENSKTLDGRRFASEFVAKRKADAVRQRNGGAGAGTTTPSGAVGSASGWGKNVSIADVVKAQPKAAEPEWVHKVVKKKGKKA